LSPLSACGLGRRLPRTSVPHASPTPRRQAQRYRSPPGEEPGRGYSARAIEIAAPLSAMGLMWAHIADVPSKETRCATTMPQLASSQRSCGLTIPPSLRRKIWHHIEASTVLPPAIPAPSGMAGKAARPQRAWARSIFTPRASEDESYWRKLLGQCCRWANSYEPQAGFGGFRQ